LWDVGEQGLYWVDIKRRLIHRFDPATGEDKSWPTPEDVGSLAVREQGGLVVALKSGFHFYNLETGEAASLSLPQGQPGNNRFNDGKPDRLGRFWAGSMDDHEKSPTGGLFRLDKNLECKQMVDGIICSNSLCWSPDNRVMYYADSWRRTIWAWDFELETGTIRNRQCSLKSRDRTECLTAQRSMPKDSSGLRSGTGGRLFGTIRLAGRTGRSGCRLRGQPARCLAARAWTRST
jgi:sugar lactone lactonase YvrE